jgi:hypothetical protein
MGCSCQTKAYNTAVSFVGALYKICSSFAPEFASDHERAVSFWVGFRSDVTKHTQHHKPLALVCASTHPSTTGQRPIQALLAFNTH